MATMPAWSSPPDGMARRGGPATVGPPRRFGSAASRPANSITRPDRRADL